MDAQEKMSCPTKGEQLACRANTNGLFTLVPLDVTDGDAYHRALGEISTTRDLARDVTIRLYSPSAKPSAPRLAQHMKNKRFISSHPREPVREGATNRDIANEANLNIFARGHGRSCCVTLQVVKTVGGACMGEVSAHRQRPGPSHLPRGRTTS